MDIIIHISKINGINKPIPRASKTPAIERAKKISLLAIFLGIIKKIF